MDAGEITLVAITLTLVGITAYFAYSINSKLKNPYTSTASVGVLSYSSKLAELFTTVLVAYLPISLIWMGFFISILSANSAFIIPSLAAIVSCFAMGGLEFVY